MEKFERILKIKRLIWAYFWLLIFEGALRKWIAPGLSAPLLVVRDPILLWMYFEAWKGSIFPKNNFVRCTIYLAVISFLMGLMAAHGNIFVTLYGIHTNFLHLPLIFLIPKVFNIDDVKKVAKWTLTISIPMAILIVMQLLLPSGHILNTAAGGVGRQIEVISRVIRPAATFSYSQGVTGFFSLVFAFLIYALLIKNTYRHKKLLTTLASIAFVSALACSGSRATFASVFLVTLSLGVIIFKKPKVIGPVLKLVTFGVILIIILSGFAFFQYGREVIETRFTLAGDVRESMVKRYITSLTEAFDDMVFFGHGVGLGTNAGTALINGNGKRKFLLAENEWKRVMLESGFIVGFLYILLRVLIVNYLARQSLESLDKENFLPVLIFGACAINIFSGQFGPPTTLGFAVFGGGLCLAACRTRTKNDSEKQIEGKIENDRVQWIN